MSQQIIQINFLFKSSKEEFNNATTMVAEYFAKLPGLQWKIWLINEERKEAGGIYLFADSVTANNYLRSPLFQKLTTNPEFANLSIKQFSTLEIPGLLTNSPIKKELIGTDWPEIDC